MTNTNCLEGVKCPQCGNEDEFRIQVTAMATVTDDGAEVEHGDMQWDDTSYAECLRCHKYGKLSLFKAQTEAPPKLPTYEVLVSRTYSVRLRIQAKSPKAAKKRVDDGDWDDGNEIDCQCLDSVVCDVTLASKSRRSA